MDMEVLLSRIPFQNTKPSSAMPASGVKPSAAGTGSSTPCMPEVLRVHEDPIMDVSWCGRGDLESPSSLSPHPTWDQRTVYGE